MRVFAVSWYEMICLLNSALSLAPNPSYQVWKRSVERPVLPTPICTKECHYVWFIFHLSVPSRGLQKAQICLSFEVRLWC